VDHDYFEHALEDMAEEYREHHERKNIRHPLRIEVETGTHPWTLARARTRAHARTHTSAPVPPSPSSTHASTNYCVFARIARNCKRIGLRGTASATDVGSETSTLEEEQES